jgi:hypothetical protein
LPDGSTDAAERRTREDEEARRRRRQLERKERAGGRTGGSALQRTVEFVPQGGNDCLNLDGLARAWDGTTMLGGDC